MAERAINQQHQQRRRSEFLNSLTPVVLSYDQLVKQKLLSGKFPLTKTGCIKVAAVIILGVALGLFVGMSICENTPEWYPYFFPYSLGTCVIVQTVLYIIFSVGWTVKHPGIWVKIDMICNLSLAVITIISSVLTMTKCVGATSLHKIPGPLGITGGIVTVIGVAAIFLMYRYVDDDKLAKPEQPPEIIDPRKSIHA